MEAISVALSQESLREFGTVLHHNIDKGLLTAGSVEKHFGGGGEKSRQPCGKNLQFPGSQDRPGDP